MQHSLAVLPFNHVAIEAPMFLAESVQQGFDACFLEDSSAPSNEDTSTASVTSLQIMPTAWGDPTLQFSLLVPSRTDNVSDDGLMGCEDNLDVVEGRSVPSLESLPQAGDVNGPGTSVDSGQSPSPVPAGLDLGDVQRVSDGSDADPSDASLGLPPHIAAPGGAIPVASLEGYEPFEAAATRARVQSVNALDTVVRLFPESAAGNSDGFASELTKPPSLVDRFSAVPTIEYAGSDRRTRLGGDQQLSDPTHPQGSHSLQAVPVVEDVERADPVMRPVIKSEPESCAVTVDDSGQSLVAKVRDQSMAGNMVLPPDSLGLRFGTGDSLWRCVFNETASPDSNPGLLSKWSVAHPTIKATEDATELHLAMQTTAGPETAVSATATGSEEMDPETGVGVRRTSVSSFKLSTMPSQDLISHLELMPQMSLDGWVNGSTGRQDSVDSVLLPVSLQPFAHSSGTSQSVQALPALPLQQVAGQLAAVLVQDSSVSTEVSLAPEELGRVRIRLEPDSANPDRMMILINVERPETLELFRRHASELAEAIRAAGYSGADIGFGQEGKRNSPDNQSSASPLDTSESSGDPDHLRPAPRKALGATLDLRL